jgi:hypothetical protein
MTIGWGLPLGQFGPVGLDSELGSESKPAHSIDSEPSSESQPPNSFTKKRSRVTPLISARHFLTRGSAY